MLIRKISTFLLAVSLVFFAAGCTSDKKEPGSMQAVGTVVISGSPTLGQVLTQLTVEFADEFINWDQVNPDFPSEEINIVISGGGTGAGINAAIDGTATFGLISRYLSEEEKAKFTLYQQFELGVDALTIAVHPANELHKLQDSLSRAELQQIFSGSIRYWDELNAALPHQEIVTVTRDVGGGAHQVFQEKVMGELEVSANAIQAPSMGALVTKIMDNENAIGYVSFGVVNQNQGQIIPMAVEGVMPTKENILEGTYEISRPLLLIANGELSPQAKALMEFLTSERSAELFSERGFVVFD